jgi:hypothetical protein
VSRIIAVVLPEGPWTHYLDRSGLGLGLDICRRSVEANDGVLSVRDVYDIIGERVDLNTTT